MTDILAELADLHKQAITKRTGRVVASATAEIVVMRLALMEIARGRTDNGRPIAAETARQNARDVLTALKVDWRAK